MRRIINAEWAGLLAAIVVGSIVLAVVSPNFLSEFNFYVLLRSVCASIVVAFAQMVTLAVGQMNLSVGALGGMVAVLFGGMMEVLGVPLSARCPSRDRDRRCGGARRRSLGGAHRHQRLHCHTGDSFRLHRRQPGSDQIRTVLQDADRAAGLWQRPDWSASVPAHRPARRLPAACPASVPPAQSAGSFLAVGGNSQAAALSGISRANAIILAHCLSGFLAAIGAVLAVAQLGSAQPLIGSDWLLLSFAAPIIGGTALAGGYVSIVGAILAVLVIALIQNGLVLAKVDPYWVQFLLGALIVATIFLNRWRARPIRLG